MLLDYDDETRVYALGELIRNSECLDYVLDAILIVLARSLAEIPVVIPFFASIDIVKAVLFLD